MRITTHDGRKIRVGRRWLPWRPRLRELADVPDPGGIGGIDDAAGFVVIVVIVLVLIFAPFVLVGVIAVFEIVLVLLVMPLYVLLRVGSGRPWTIQATEGRRILGVESVRGWAASSARILEVANGYERGEPDPFTTSSRQ